MENRYGNDVKYKSIRDDYKTPKEIYNSILAVLSRDKFDIDVACTDKNIPAKDHYTKTIDGLKQEWSGFCFCNPPWKKTRQFMKKAVESKNAMTAFVISSSKFETKYMQEYVLNNNNACFCILPLKQGFIIPGEEDIPPVPSVPVAIVFICPDEKMAEQVKLISNGKNLFKTTMFRGGGKSVSV